MVKATRDLILSAWSNELQNDFDKEFLLHGIEFGFDIIDASDIPLNIQAKNHPSASPSGPLYSKAHAQVLIEIENGNYIFADEKPKIISPMGVIPKPGAVYGSYMIVVDLKVLLSMTLQVTHRNKFFKL